MNENISSYRKWRVANRHSAKTAAEACSGCRSESTVLVFVADETYNMKPDKTLWQWSCKTSCLLADTQRLLHTRTHKKYLIMSVSVINLMKRSQRGIKDRGFLVLTVSTVEELRHVEMTQYLEKHLCVCVLTNSIIVKCMSFMKCILNTHKVTGNFKVV